MGIEFEYTDELVDTIENPKGKVTVQQHNKTDELEYTLAPSPTVDTAVSGLARVGYTMSHTKNLGNFESVKVGVSIVRPIVPEQISQAHAANKEWVENKMEEIVTEIAAAVGDTT